MSNLFQKCSEWWKWNLRFHISFSLINNQFQKMKNGKLDWEPFLNNNSLDMTATGMIDYFIIEFESINEIIEIGEVLKKIHLKSKQKKFNDFIK